MISRPALIGAAVASALASLFVLDANLSLYVSDAARHTPRNLEDKFGGARVLVVGASSGIGAEVSRVLCAQTTARLTLVARRTERLREVVTGGCSGPPPAIVTLDVTSNETEAVVEGIVEKSGGVDVLILNAGRFLEVPTLEVDIEQARDIIELNLMSSIRIVTTVMKSDDWEAKGKGHVAVTSSLAGKFGVPISSAYAASKHALHGYFSSLRAEFAWLRVDIVCPGAVRTEIFDKSNRARDKKGIVSTIPGSIMSTPRAARLFLSAMMGTPAVLFQETWIARGLSLLASYQGVYAPVTDSFVRAVLDPIVMRNFNNGEGFGFGFLDGFLSIGQR